MDPSRSAHEQGITEGLAQTIERETGGRLAHTKTACSLADASHAKQRIEDHKQVQIDFCDIHSAYILYTVPQSFQICRKGAKSRVKLKGTVEMQKSKVVRVERDGEVALVIANNPPVNTITADVRAGLRAALDELKRLSGVKAVLLMCEGSTFFSGADIGEFSGPPKEEEYRSLFNDYE